MAEPLVINEFLALLEKSRLLTPAQIKTAVDKFDLLALPECRDVAQRLVNERVLTPYQGERLLQGRYRGFVIDRYRVREILGAGGMGCIYIAEDPLEKKKVALKVMSSEHEVDSGMLTRMKLEAKAGMNLRHPRIVETYRFDQTGAVTFLVMELFRGVSLHELIALQGALPWSMACEICRQIAEGLQYAHESGIIHRDVKPANFLISKTGDAKILDFGLALLQDDADEEFSLRMIFGHDCLGTPDYIAPEQTLNSSNVDCRADIYSLGCTLYLMITGKLPFPYKTTSAKLEAQRTKRARSISEYKPEVPAEVVAIVERMMRKDPKNRFASMLDVQKAIAPFAKRQAVAFEFREILSLRAKQAKQKVKATKKRKAPGRSSTIGGVSEWNLNSSQALQPEVETLVNSGDTSPAVDTRMPAEAARIQQAGNSTPEIAAAVPLTDTKWWIVSAEGRRIQLTTSPFSIGRDAGCSMQLDRPGVSNRHCSLQCDDGVWRIVDHNSKNGVYVNARKVPAQQLDTGDTFSLGQNLVFEITDVPATRSLISDESTDYKQLSILIGGGVIALSLLGLLLWSML